MANNELDNELDNEPDKQPWYKRAYAALGGAAIPAGIPDYSVGRAFRVAYLLNYGKRTLVFDKSERKDCAKELSKSFIGSPSASKTIAATSKLRWLNPLNAALLMVDTLQVGMEAVAPKASGFIEAAFAVVTTPIRVVNTAINYVLDTPEAVLGHYVVAQTDEGPNKVKPTEMPAEKALRKATKKLAQAKEERDLAENQLIYGAAYEDHEDPEDPEVIDPLRAKYDSAVRDYKAAKEDYAKAVSSMSVSRPTSATVHAQREARSVGVTPASPRVVSTTQQPSAGASLLSTASAADQTSSQTASVNPTPGRVVSEPTAQVQTAAPSVSVTPPSPSEVPTTQKQPAGASLLSTASAANQATSRTASVRAQTMTAKKVEVSKARTPGMFDALSKELNGFFAGLSGGLGFFGATTVKTMSEQRDNPVRGLKSR